MQYLGCAESSRCPINVCGVTCAQGGLGCHPVLAFLPIRSPEMPSDVLSWPLGPSCVHPLPFILLALTKAFVLGFRLSRRWTGRRRATSWSGSLCSFPLSLSRVWAGIWRRVGRGCTCRRVTVFTTTSQCSAETRDPDQAVTPGWEPDDTSLVQEHRGPGLELGEFANQEVLVLWVAQGPSWLPLPPGC